MTALLWQTALLLLGAYFLGAFTGCLVRRTFFARLPVQAGEPQLAAVSAGGGNVYAEDELREFDQPATYTRFERAPAGEDFSAEPQSAIDTNTELTGGQAKLAPAAVVPVTESAVPETVEDAPEPPPSVELRLPAATRSVGTSAAAAAALAAATARRQAAQAASRAEEKSPPSLPTPAISREQVNTSAPPVNVSAPLPEQSGPAPEPADDLLLIKGIDAELQKRLNTLGVSRFAQIASWLRDDVRRISRELGFRGRIEQENWIEQAQMLENGAETAYSRQVRLGLGQLANPSPDRGIRRPISAGTQAPAVDKGAAPAVATTPAASQSRRPATGAGWDKLLRISGITEEIERLLNLQGITRYEQIARWTSSEVARFERLLGGDGRRISRENWIEQAEILARGGETNFSRAYDQKNVLPPSRPRPTHLAEAIRAAQAGKAPEPANPEPKVDFSTLRSVRPEVPQQSAVPAAEPIPPAQSLAPADDLKRIKGIDAALEEQLNKFGCSTYRQIANWTAADVAKISRTLGFKGRIERENWVEQAGILASGGQTQFAKRYDCGERAIGRPIVE